MFLGTIDVPQGTRLLFQPEKGPLTHVDNFFDLGSVVRAERHADESTEQPDDRMILDCEGVEASEATRLLAWPKGETLMPGTVKFGDNIYPALLQVRAGPRGLRAILRSVG